LIEEILVAENPKMSSMIVREPRTARAFLAEELSRALQEYETGRTDIGDRVADRMSRDAHSECTGRGIRNFALNPS